MIKESGIQTAIETYLRYQENQGKLIYIKQNSGALRTKRGGFVRFGKKGASDFLIFLKNGATIHLEIKRDGGKQSKSQVEFQNKLELLGHDYRIAYSVDDVKSIIDSY